MVQIKVASIRPSLKTGRPAPPNTHTHTQTVCAIPTATAALARLNNGTECAAAHALRDASQMFDRNLTCWFGRWNWHESNVSRNIDELSSLWSNFSMFSFVPVHRCQRCSFFGFNRCQNTIVSFYCVINGMYLWSGGGGAINYRKNPLKEWDEFSFKGMAEARINKTDSGHSC